MSLCFSKSNSLVLSFPFHSSCDIKPNGPYPNSYQIICQPELSVTLSKLDGLSLKKAINLLMSIVSVCKSHGQQSPSDLGDCHVCDNQQKLYFSDLCL